MITQVTQRSLAALCLCLSGSLATQAAEATRSFAFDPSVGETRTYLVEKTRETHRNGEIKTTQLTLSIPITLLEKDADGLVFQTTYGDIAITAPAPGTDGHSLSADLARLTEGFPFHYRATPTGVPIALSNMDAVKSDLLPSVFEKIDDIIAKYGSDPSISASLEPVRQSFANMTPEAAVQMTLRDLQPIFSMTGLELPENEPLAIHQQVPWEMTGSNLTAVGEMKIAKISDDAATITLHQSYTRESVRNGVAFLMAQLAGMDKAAMEKATRQIRAWEDYDIQTTITVIMPLSESWPRQIDHRQTLIAAGQKQITHATYILDE